MPRAYWKGFLRLSLVSCPIALYPATTAAEKTRFHQINKRTGNRLRQQMVDEETGRIVEKDNKSRGYEVSKGRYVEIDPDELDAVELVSTHTIEIDEFVPAEDIDERFLDRPYYIAPDGKTGADAFVVIRDAMKKKGHAALGRIVLTNREHVLKLQPLGKGLLGTTLRYPYELRDEADYFKSIPSPRVTSEMVNLAAHILDTKTAKFAPDKFKDKYETALKKLVKRKAAGKTIEPRQREEPGEAVVDLMQALKQSLGRGPTARRLRGAAHPPGAGKRRPRRRAA